jgi:hypothetical protein
MERKEENFYNKIVPVKFPKMGPAMTYGNHSKNYKTCENKSELAMTTVLREFAVRMKRDDNSVLQCTLLLKPPIVAGMVGRQSLQLTCSLRLFFVSIQIALKKDTGNCGRG